MIVNIIICVIILIRIVNFTATPSTTATTPPPPFPPQHVATPHRLSCYTNPPTSPMLPPISLPSPPPHATPSSPQSQPSLMPTDLPRLRSRDFGYHLKTMRHWSPPPTATVSTLELNKPWYLPALLSRMAFRSFLPDFGPVRMKSLDFRLLACPAAVGSRSVQEMTYRWSKTPTMRCLWCSTRTWERRQTRCWWEPRVSSSTCRRWRGTTLRATWWPG